MNQDRVMLALSQVARENGVTLKSVIQEIEQIIDHGFHSENEQIRKSWEEIPKKGTVLTVQELVAYCTNAVEQAACTEMRKKGVLRLPEK